MIIKIATVFLFYLFCWFCCFLGTGTDRKNFVPIPLFAVVAVQTAGIVTGIG